jgi:hypothetical protein
MPSEHGVAVCHLLRHGLPGIPVFDNPAIFQTEDVNAGKAAVTRGL